MGGKKLVKTFIKKVPDRSRGRSGHSAVKKSHDESPFFTRRLRLAQLRTTGEVAQTPFIHSFIHSFPH